MSALSCVYTSMSNSDSLSLPIVYTLLYLDVMATLSVLGISRARGHI